jgi:hypothetical protein
MPNQSRTGKGSTGKVPPVPTIGDAQVNRLEIGGLVVHTDVVSHPLLGDAHIIEHNRKPITAMSAIDWDRPTRIPTIAEPRALPAGSGSALLNEIARRAQAAGVTALRYAGPYPTHALFKSLLRSFRTEADEDDFTNDVLGRAMRVARDEIAVDFTPAPFTRRATQHGFVDVRDGAVERVQIGGVVYDVDGTVGSLARLLPTSHGWAARLGFGTEYAWTTIADLDAKGEVVDGPHAMPRMKHDVIGKEFPRELRMQFADAVGDLVATPLADDAKAAVLARPVVWQDLGWRSAAKHGEGFALHAAMWTVVAPQSRQQFVLTVSYHLAMIVQTTLVDEVAATLR